MYIDANKVTLLHVELTSRCNASCPGCLRNNNGFGLRPGLVLMDIPIKTILQEMIKFPNLKVLHLCGNLGDPIAYKHLIPLLIKVEQYNKIQLHSLRQQKYIDIHTNGSLRSVKWWEEFGENLHTNFYNNHQVVFGIDGLEDTHSIHRQGTNFNKIIDNARAFINAGGVAEWQYLKFKHNEHQVDEARQLAQDMGFKEFFVMKPFIWPKARHWKTGELLSGKRGRGGGGLQQSYTYTDRQVLNDAVDGSFTLNNYVKEKDCMHVDIDRDNTGNYSLFLSVTGKILPCCHWNNDLSHKEKYDIDTLDIKEEFNNNDYRLTCRIICGSCK
jgi:MoaA/NifB/PqqE/SkfB family radical SAM enzyme